MRKGYESRNGSKGGPKFVQIFDAMMKTPAWRDLSPIARALYVELKARYNTFNNGSIGFGVRSAGESLNIGRNVAGRALKELQKHGFIAPQVPGKFNTNGRRATEWRLTELVCNVTGKSATRDYLQWRPEIHSQVTPAGQQVTPAGQSSNIIPLEKPLRRASGTQEAKSAPQQVTPEGRIYI